MNYESIKDGLKSLFQKQFMGYRIDFDHGKQDVSEIINSKLTGDKHIIIVWTSTIAYPDAIDENNTIECHQRNFSCYIKTKDDVFETTEDFIDFINDESVAKFMVNSVDMEVYFGSAIPVYLSGKYYVEINLSVRY